MNNYDELRQRVAVARERVEMAEHESNCLVYGIEPHECSCVVSELADLVSDLLDENAALRALIRNLLPGQVQLDAIRAAEEALGDAS
jgi:hypothetical protein